MVSETASLLERNSTDKARERGDEQGGRWDPKKTAPLLSNPGVESERKQSTSFEEDVRQELEKINREIDAQSLSPALKQPLSSDPHCEVRQITTFICAECHRVMPQEAERYPHHERLDHHAPKRIIPSNSLKKLGLTPIEATLE